MAFQYCVTRQVIGGTEATPDEAIRMPAGDGWRLHSAANYSGKLAFIWEREAPRDPMPMPKEQPEGGPTFAGAPGKGF